MADDLLQLTQLQHLKTGFANIAMILGGFIAPGVVTH